MDTETALRLIAAAERGRMAAYAPYSGFRVGAAVLAGGRTYVGGNIENASYGLTICAERVAVGTAVADGHRRIEAVAVVSDAPAPTPPCGACRQVLYEFGPTMMVALSGGDETALVPLAELLPRAFGPANLGRPPATGRRG